MQTIRISAGDDRSLTAALRKRHDGPTTIVVEPGHYVIGTVAVRGDVRVQSSEGAAHTVLEAMVDGDLVKVTERGSHVVFRGLTFEGAEAPIGGAMHVGSDASVRLEDCVLRKNKAPQLMGGAIAVVQQAKLFVERCVFVGNESERGGAIAVSDGAVAHVDRSVFTDNRAKLGGALFADRQAEVRVTSCSFFDNVASHERGGGALFFGGTPNAGPRVDGFNNLFVGADVVVNNPNRPARLALGHCLFPEQGLAALAFDDRGNNLETRVDLVKLADGMWALAAGSIGSGSADLSLIPEDARDLLNQPMIADGRADPGALAPRRS